MKNVRTFENDSQMVTKDVDRDGSRLTHDGVDSEESVPREQQSVRKKRRKKPKNMPRRPLSAYNFFFKHQRSLVAAQQNDQRASQGANTVEDLFCSMGREVAKRWKELTETDKLPFKIKAAQDAKRYKLEMAEYNYKEAYKTAQAPFCAVSTSKTQRNLAALDAKNKMELQPREDIRLPVPAVKDSVQPGINVMTPSQSQLPSTVMSSRTNTIGTPNLPRFAPQPMVLNSLPSAQSLMGPGLPAAITNLPATSMSILNGVSPTSSTGISLPLHTTSLLVSPNQMVDQFIPTNRIETQISRLRVAQSFQQAQQLNLIAELQRCQTAFPRFLYQNQTTFAGPALQSETGNVATSSIVAEKQALVTLLRNHSASTSILKSPNRKGQN